MQQTTCTSAIDKQLACHAERIEDWFQKERFTQTPIVYASFDLRYSGFKLSVIDTNLYPAGFNNLTQAARVKLAEYLQQYFRQQFPGKRRILIIPESHTRNPMYMENLAILIESLQAGNLTVRVGSLLEDLHRPEVIQPPNQAPFTLEPLMVHNGQIVLADYEPEVVLLNNDLATGIPLALQAVVQPIVPSPLLGWWQRTKTGHFHFYQQWADKLATHLGVDSWFLAPLFSQANNIDFKTRVGEEALLEQVHTLLVSIRQKYKEYAISLPPYVVVKADAGTYGMAVMVIKDAADLKALNRRQRQHMAMTKGHRPVHQVILQEGVYTIETKGTPLAVAEPVIYAVNSQIAGGFYRLHGERGVTDNLNSPGMYFLPMVDQPNIHFDWQDPAHVRFYAYTVVARLGLLAIQDELRALTSKGEGEHAN